MRKLLVLLCFMLVPMQAWAAGYAVYEWSARGNALGGAMVARDGDPSSIAYNPANITDLPGAQVQVGATAIAPTAKMTARDASTTGTEFSDSVWGLPTFYYTQQLSDNYWFGIGMFSRVGLGTEYKNSDAWGGRYNNTHAGIQSVTINPNIAMKFSDQFSMAFGLDATYLRFMYGSVFSNNVEQDIDADGWGIGFNLGARYKPCDWLAFGVSYRNEIPLTVNGKVDYEAKVPAAAGAANLLNQSNGINGTEPVPGSATFGVMVKPMDKLSLEFDAVWTKWDSYKTLTMNYENVLGSKSATKNWDNSWRYQFGAEYALTDAVDLRLGYVYDKTPVNDMYADYAVPCSNRQIVTTGFGWKIDEAWVLDAFYGYLWMTDREYSASATGTVNVTREDAHAHMGGLSLTYKF